MPTRDQLLNRLSEIAEALKRSGQGVALLALGSVGLETDRIDAYSDLDFFAVVADGTSDSLIDDLSWLEEVHPLAYAHKNTEDGYKILFEDGIFGEFAVLDSAKLRQIPYPPARIVWKTDAFDEALANGNQVPPQNVKHALNWLIGEILTNLYVGLGRYHRGERLSALKFVQGFAVDRILQLALYIEPAQTAHRDAFGLERRFEKRFPGIAPYMPGFMQGYDRTPESAQAILEFLGQHFDLNEPMRNAILDLIHQGADA